MHAKTAIVLFASLASAAAAGCSTSGGPAPDGETATVRASLHRAKSCGDLLGDLKADAIYKLNKGIDQQRKGIELCQQRYGDAQCASGGYYGGVSADFGGERGTAVGTSAPPQATPSDSAGSPTSPDKGSNEAAESASSYSETNTQVQGVDEADIVKNDGKNLYILHGRSFKVINAWPANELKEVTTTDIEGSPTEMFVADGKVIIYSQVNGAAVFAAAGITPKTRYNDYGYGYAGSSGGRDIAAPVAPGGVSTPGNPGTATPYVPLTKITVLTFDGTATQLATEVYFEGSYLDSRRVGSNVRTVLQGYQYGPQLKYSVYDLLTPTPANGSSDVKPAEPSYPKTGTEAIAALEKLRAANLAILNASQLGDWLPNTFVKSGSTVAAQTVACEDFYVPTAGSTESGLTEVASLDLANPAAKPQETVILGRADTVYGNADTLYLAAQAWVEPPFIWYDEGTTGSGGTTAASPPDAPTTEPAKDPDPAPAPAPTPGENSFRPGNAKTQANPPASSTGVVTWSASRTHVHKFEFKTQPNFPNYVASGTVAGSVKNQFSLDEKDGFLRIATTESRQYSSANGKYLAADSSPPTPGTPPPARPSTVNHVFVLGQDGGWLEQKGEVADLAPNEQIYSVRFVEDRGYVVTFRQVDPLFVLDLKTPTAPQLLAALKIPGFSEYMHPIDANHLLTIGRDAGPDGRTRGLQLQIFDVTDGKNPIQKHTFKYSGEEYGQSEAQYDHKAFTYFADKNLLAFPYQSYGNTDGGMRSSLELFKVDLAAGFSKLGSIDHTALVQKNPSGYCGGYYGPTVRRGVFLENFVYSISYGGIVAKNVGDLASDGTTLPLPAPQIDNGYGPSCYDAAE